MPVNLNSGKLALLVVAVVLTPLIFYYKFYLSGAGVEMSSLNVLADEVPASLEEKQKNVVSVEGYADVNVRNGCLLLPLGLWGGGGGGGGGGIVSLTRPSHSRSGTLQCNWPG